jgi:hypothetical protein
MPLRPNNPINPKIVCDKPLKHDIKTIGKLKLIVSLIDDCFSIDGCFSTADSVFWLHCDIGNVGFFITNIYQCNKITCVMIDRTASSERIELGGQV